MPNEYTLPIGLDLTSLGISIAEAKKDINNLKVASQQSTQAMQQGFNIAAEAQQKLTRDTIKSTQEVKQQAALGKELSQIFNTLATASSRASDTAPIKKYTEEFKKLADLASKSTKFNIQFDDADLILFDGILSRTQGELKELQAIIEVLKPKLEGLDPNSEEFQLLSQQVSTAENVISEFNSEIEKTSGSSKSLKSELKQLKADLAAMEEQGLEGGVAFEKMAIRAGELEDQLGDTAQRIRVLASDTKYIDATIEAVGAVTAGFGLAQGATAIFGTENEALAETLNKVQGAMLILNSLQQIQQVLQKQSALAILTTRTARQADVIATEAQIVATEGQAVATNIANTATKSLWATMVSNPIGLILAGLGTLLAVLSSYKSKAQEAAEAQTSLNESILKSAQAGLQGELDFIERQSSLSQAKLKQQGASDGELFKQQQISQQLRIDSRLRFINEIKDAGGDEASATLELKNDLAKLELDKVNFQTEQNKKAAAARSAAIQKAKQDRDSDFQNQQQYLASLEDLQKQYRDTLVTLIEDERVRSKEELNNKFKDDQLAVDKLLVQQKKTGKLTVELQKAADDQKRALKQKYNTDVLKIDTEFFASQSALLKQANDIIEESYQTSTGKQVLELRKKYDDIIIELKASGEKLSANEKEQLAAINEAIFAITSSKELAIKKILSDSKLSEIENQKELAISTLDALKIQGISEEQLTKLKQDRKLEIEKDFADRSLGILVKSLIDQRKLSKEQAENLTVQNLEAAASSGTDLFSFLGISFDDADARRKIQELLITLQKQAEEASTESNFSLKNAIFKIIGLDPNDPETNLALQSIGDAVSQITASITADAQRQLEAINQVIDALDDQIEKQQDAVDEQKELSDKGLANDLINQQKLLDDLKAKKAAEISEREKAQQKLAEIRKQEAIIQSASIVANNIETGANMINALSKIFKAHSGIPFVGVALAAGFAALMISTFLTVKNAIKSSQQEVPTFKKGGGLQLKGPGHEAGGIGLYDDSTGERIAEYEGDEYLYAINKRSTKKHLQLLDAINQDDSKAIKVSLIKLLSGTGVRLPDDDIRQINTNTREVYVMSLENKDANKSLSAIEEHTKNLLKMESSKRKVTDYGSYIEIVEGNSVRKVRKK